MKQIFYQKFLYFLKILDLKYDVYFSDDLYLVNFNCLLLFLFQFDRLHTKYKLNLLFEIILNIK